MKLTTKGRYAVTAMMDLALHAKLDRVSLVDIAERQKISFSYLEQLFRSLRQAELVVSSRGAKGGYMLARDAKEISLADILIAADEKINLACGGGNTCDDTQPCLTHNLWTNLSREFFEFLNSKKLSDLVRSRHVQTLATQQDVTQIGDIPIQISRY
ncbi:Rrf2 family transcriptional regulator [Arenicella xantha]|uniref:BadM/Rrf2 family transcriptional regulator n=1 Tax=Arenicella xantha TaxID=644221 RepID=A0A395JVM9_9GAMM|nr:Rrf2 family transcriptional regulator [Arenicella xantha]RBP53628.1 BadM/Rrf2 family transcriptional regulator [Arenicella xantha]